MRKADQMFLATRNIRLFLHVILHKNENLKITIQVLQKCQNLKIVLNENHVRIYDRLTSKGKANLILTGKVNLIMTCCIRHSRRSKST